LFRHEAGRHPVFPPSAGACAHLADVLRVRHLKQRDLVSAARRANGEAPGRDGIEFGRPARCSRRGNLGATIQRPSYANAVVGFRSFPIERRCRGLAKPNGAATSHFRLFETSVNVVVSL